MALFKEIKCVHCGKKTGMLSRTQLMNGEYVCSDCITGFPAETVALLHKCANGEEFAKLRYFFDDLNKKREKIFKETARYKCVHLDAEGSLFYLDDVRPRIYFSMYDMEEFELSFRPVTVKEGFLNDKVTGDVHLTVKSRYPLFVRQNIIAKDVKTTGEIKGMIKKRVEWENPKGINEINACYHEANYIANRDPGMFDYGDDEKE